MYLRIANSDTIIGFHAWKTIIFANYATAKIYYEDTSARHAYLIKLYIVTDTVEAEEMSIT